MYCYMYTVYTLYIYVLYAQLRQLLGFDTKCSAIHVYRVVQVHGKLETGIA